MENNERGVCGMKISVEVWVSVVKIWISAVRISTVSIRIIYT